MLTQGFFDIGISTAPKHTPKKKYKDCEDCGLCKSCDNPEFKVKGNGKKGILIIGDFPSKLDDSRKRYFSGPEGSLIWDMAKELDIDFEEDCWFVNAVSCYPGQLHKERAPERHKKIKDKLAKAVDICRPKLKAVIEKLNPSIIIPMGEYAIEGLIWERIGGRISKVAKSDFFGFQIPDQELKAWVCPTYSPLYIEAINKKATKGIYAKLFQEHLELAIEKVGVKLLKPFNEIHTTNRQEEAIEWLWKARASKSVVAYDYETNAISPYQDNKKIPCASIAFDKVGYSFPFFNTKLWQKEWNDFLAYEKIQTAAHNATFERLWTYKRSGENKFPTNTTWDTCIAAHCLNNQSPTSLKFQTYVHLGILGFDKDVDFFITTPQPGQPDKGTHLVNRIDECPTSVLLKYNAYDSLYTHQLQLIQEKLMTKKQRDGFSLFMRASEMLARVSDNGMNVNVEQMEQHYIELTEKIDGAYAALMALPDVKKFGGLDIASNTSLSAFFYDFLKLPVGHKGKKVDEEALSTYDHPIVCMLLEYKKAIKLRDTYLAQFKREEHEGKIHTSFNLNNVVTFRSCIAKGAMIACKDGEKAIEDVEVGDLVLTYEDNLSQSYRKVLWSGKTGEREVVCIGYTYCGDEQEKHGFGCLHLTPEHRIRKANGEWVEAQSSFGHRILAEQGTVLIDILQGTTLYPIKEVYDLEVEETHNFIANGICVHNSSSDPNFQNIPIRSSDGNKYIRGIIYPDEGCQIVEYDYKSLEVQIGTTYHKDPNMIAYLKSDEADFHTDTGLDLFLRKGKLPKDERAITKNKFVFPEFYGSTARAMEGQQIGTVTRDLWQSITQDTKLHLYNEGIRDIKDFQAHIVDVENKLWNERFPVYNEWRTNEWKSYQKKGFLDTYTGFRIYGPLSYTQAINIRTQGTACHVLLYTQTGAYPKLLELSGKSYFTAQIHDSMVTNMFPKDMEQADSLIKYFGTVRVVERYPELEIVPLVIEKDVAGINEPWSMKKPAGKI